MDRVLVELTRLMNVEVTWFLDLLIRVTALKTVFCASINSVRHCHSVYLGWAFPAALINVVYWIRYLFLMGLGIITTSLIAH